MTITPNDVLENSKDKFTQVVVIGVDKNGELDINTNNPSFPLLHFLLNRAIFKLNVFEDREIANFRAKKGVEAVPDDKTPIEKEPDEDKNLLDEIKGN
jgi:hypothetical protein